MERLNVPFPRWAVILYGVIGISLIPWIFDLAVNLPSHHTDSHWDMLWVGFDIMILASVFATLFFARRKSVWVVLPASSLATLFLVDVWFDILTAKPGRERFESVLFGLFEILLSLLTFRIVYMVVHKATPQKNIKLGIKS